MTNAQDIKIYRDFFKGRLDDFAEQTEAGEYYRLGKPFEESCIAEHLEGHKSYGMYLIIPDSNLCWHTVIDIDVLEIEPVTFIIAALLKIGIKDTQILLEFSGSKGYHVWLTFDKAIDSWKTLKLGQAIVESSGIETKIEVSPKQDSVAKDKFGSLIKLPLGVHKKSGKRSCFLGTKFEPITDWCSHLTSIEKVSIEQLDSILLEVFKQEHFMVVKTQLDERMPI
ncbi:MAG: hypothetical protein NTV71_01800, partial [Candidatus Omnitrophica bacterium]|nr:hypothetical protein [Candidatus Omnitrophota bacterium]